MNKEMQDWDISLQNFEAGHWGNTMGTFKVPSYYSNRFVDDKGNYHKEAAFDEIATKIIHIIKHLKPILNKIKFQYGNQISTGFDERTKSFIRKATYIGIQWSIENDNFIENNRGTSIKINGSSIIEKSSGFRITADMLGKHAWNALQNSGIDRWNLISEDVYYSRDLKGNIELRGKISIDKMDTL